MRIIAGKLKGRVLRTVEGPGYRPAMSMVREALFSMLESRGLEWQNCQVLDLFAGSGSLGFEALSRGAAKVLYVELEKKAAACLSDNARKLGVEAQCHVIADEVIRVVGRKSREKYHLVFIDPPYAQDLLPPTLRALMRNGWLHEDSYIIAEIEKHLDFNAEAVPGLDLDTERRYGQTRICIWTPSPESA